MRPLYDPSSVLLSYTLRDVNEVRNPMASSRPPGREGNEDAHPFAYMNLYPIELPSRFPSAAQPQPKRKMLRWKNLSK